MDVRKVAAATLGVLLVSAAGITWATAASAAGPEPVGTLALTPATVERGGASFYDPATFEEAWRVAALAFDEELPAGYRPDPELPPSFKELGPGENLFEAQIVDTLASTYYRCAWLDAGFAGLATQEQVDKATEHYWSLPSVKQFDLTGLDTDLEKIADYIGYEDLDRALFDLTCNGWEK